MRHAVHTVDATLPVVQQESASEIYAESLAGQVFATHLTSAFAVIGLLVAAIGVYASMALDLFCGSIRRSSCERSDQGSPSHRWTAATWCGKGRRAQPASFSFSIASLREIPWLRARKAPSADPVRSMPALQCT